VEAVANTDVQFDVPASLRKWPSRDKERVGRAVPCSVFDGTFAECIRQFMSKPMSQLHLYEIHTAPQGELIPAVLSVEQIIELAALTNSL
jgi:hypothetical protein